MSGLLPTRLVHTRCSPFGVEIGIMRTPSVCISSLAVWSGWL